MLSCIYLTRKCPHKCHYCRIRESSLTHPDMTAEEWQHAFTILKKWNVKFHLLLGNELMSYDGVVEVIDWLSNIDKTPYAFYTTSPPNKLAELGEQLVSAGLSNASTGFDMFPEDEIDRDDPLFFMKLKSKWGIEGLEYFQQQGVPDLQGTVTVSRHNKDIALELLRYLTKKGIYSGINPIHWDKDGGYDFFPPLSILEDEILTQSDIDGFVGEIKAAQQRCEISLQNPPEYFDAWKKHGANLDWHCSLPLIITIDADGSLRCCGYRRGDHASTFHIFDLEEEINYDAYWDAWREDMQNCPGCLWSYWWMAENYLPDDAQFGYQLFQTHRSRYFPGFGSA